MDPMHQENAIDPGLVRAKAYEIWQSLGCPDGAAEQTWYEAERQLRSRLGEPKRSGAAASSPKPAPLAEALEPASPVIEPATTGHANSSAPPPASEVSSKGKRASTGSKRTARR